MRPTLADEYYSQLYPEPSVRISEFGRWKRATTCRNIANALAKACEGARRRWHIEPKSFEEGRLGHPPLVLWLPHVANGACLACAWIDNGSVSLEEAADIARNHSIDCGDDALVVRNLFVPIAERGAEWDEPLHPKYVPPQMGAGFNRGGTAR